MYKLKPLLASFLLAVLGSSGMAPAQQILPAPGNPEVDSVEVLADTISPDGKLALAIHTNKRTKALSLEVVQVADNKVLWRSNPTGDDTDVFRYRLRAHGFRDMQYAWSPDSKLLAMAVATSRGSWVYVFQQDPEGGYKQSTLRELGDEQLFGDQLPPDPAVREKQGGVRKLYMNLEFTSNTVLEVSTEGFFLEAPTAPNVPVRTLYFEALVAYDLAPGTTNPVPKQQVNVEPVGKDEEL